MERMGKLTRLSIILFLLTGLMLTSCNKDDDDSIDQPDEYRFDNNVDYSSQTARIKLLHELSGKVGQIEDNPSTDKVGTSESELRNIYENNGAISESESLAEKTFNENGPGSSIWQKADFQQFFTDATPPYSTGDTITNGRLFKANGVEPQQYIEKGLMGAVFYWQATSVHLNNLGQKSNEAPNNATASPRARSFDKAFGYLGVPQDFLNNDNDEVDGDYTGSSWFWGHYIRSRNSVLEIKEPLFNAFLKGRTAIVNGNSDKRKEAVKKIKTLWEELVAANVVHYINSTLSDMENNNKFSKWHVWAEAKAFHICLAYNDDKSISDSDWQDINNLIGSSPKTVSKSDLEQANTKLQQVFNFSDSEMSNL